MNEVNLIGRLGQDPVFKKSENGRGNDWILLSICTNKKEKDGTETPVWHAVFVFGKTCDIVKDWKKGMQVYVKGELNYKKVSTGQDKYVSSASIRAILVVGGQEARTKELKTEQFVADELPF